MKKVALICIAFLFSSISLASSKYTSQNGYFVVSDVNVDDKDFYDMVTMKLDFIKGTFKIVSATKNDSTQLRRINANQEWQSTGIIVNSTQMVCANASGLWSHGGQGIQAIRPYYGPRGFGKDEPNLIPEIVSRTGALIGKIKNNEAFLIEDSLCFIPTNSGELLFQMNDVPGAFDNNDGFMDVKITIKPIKY